VAAAPAGVSLNAGADVPVEEEDSPSVGLLRVESV
jgi:hypothetical protein